MEVSEAGAQVYTRNSDTILTLLVTRTMLPQLRCTSFASYWCLWQRHRAT
jgi:hypothetical protein